MSEIKPCPFCGGDAKLKRIFEGYSGHPTTIEDMWTVECENGCCDIGTFRSEIFQDEEGEVIVRKNGAVDAVEAWNRRYFQ